MYQRITPGHTSAIMQGRQTHSSSKLNNFNYSK